MAKSKGDYDGWITRMIDNMEDVIHSFTLANWLDYARKNIEPRQGYELTPSQIGILADKHNTGQIWDIIEADLKIRVERPFRYKGQIVLRNLETGRFTSRTKVNTLLATSKRDYGMHKRIKEYVTSRFRKTNA